MKTIMRFFIVASLVLTQISFAQWVHTNGPCRGSANCFAVIGSNIFAGGSGVFLSTDNGMSWKSVSTGLTNDVLALAVSGTNLFAGTDGGGVFLSTNNGTSWTAINTGLPQYPFQVYALAISGTDIFAGGDDGVFLSTNNGTSWTAINTGLPPYVDVYALAFSGANLFAAVYDASPSVYSVYLSTNNGTSWSRPANSGYPGTYISVLAVRGTDLFVGSGDLYRSTDNGTSWTATGIPNYAGAMALLVSGSNLFAGTENGVFLSTNNGASWTSASNGLPTEPGVSTAYIPVHALALSGTTLFAGTIDGVFRSTDNSTSWSFVFLGGNANVSVNALTVKGAELFAGTSWGYEPSGGYIFHSTDNGDSWVPQLECYAGDFAVSGTNVFAGTNRGVFRTTLGGTSWTSAGLADTSVNALIVSGNNLFASGGGGLFLSTNNGTSWTVAGLTNTWVSALVVHGTNLFASTSGFMGGVLLSTNGGATWTAVSNGLPKEPYDSAQFIPIKALAVSGTYLFAGTGEAAFNGGVFRSTNNGTSWTQFSNGLPKSPNDTTQYSSINSLAIYGPNLFAGTGSGVFLSTNSGMTWQAFNTGFKQGVSALGFNDTYVFAGTPSHYSRGDDYIDGTGLWRRPLSEMVTGVSQRKSDVPSQFALRQNYPNPFNPSTTIQYQIPKQSYVTLEIFDLLGRETASLVNEIKQAGTHTVKWDASRLSSGVYFYTITAGAYRETKRMILMK